MPIVKESSMIICTNYFLQSFIFLVYVLQSCWNCGRKASETCSGCNVARYCGSFCQHKDWENHHRVCGQTVAHSSSGSGGPSSSSTNSTNPKQESSLHSSTNSKEESKPKKVTAEKDAKKPEMPVTVTISPSQASPAAAPSPTDSTASSTKPGSRASSPTDTKAQVVWTEYCISKYPGPAKIPWLCYKNSFQRRWTLHVGW